MTSREFCYWLQGFFEIQGDGAAAITATQSNCIRKHLSMVFRHEIDPSYGDAEAQAKLSALHEGVEQAKKDAADAKKAAQNPPYRKEPLIRC